MTRSLVASELGYSNLIISPKISYYFWEKYTLTQSFPATQHILFHVLALSPLPSEPPGGILAHNPWVRFSSHTSSSHFSGDKWIFLYYITHVTKTRQLCLTGLTLLYYLLGLGCCPCTPVWPHWWSLPWTSSSHQMFRAPNISTAMHSTPTHLTVTAVFLPASVCHVAKASPGLSIQWHWPVFDLSCPLGPPWSCHPLTGNLSIFAHLQIPGTVSLSNMLALSLLLITGDAPFLSYPLFASESIHSVQSYPSVLPKWFLGFYLRARWKFAKKSFYTMPTTSAPYLHTSLPAWSSVLASSTLAVMFSLGSLSCPHCNLASNALFPHNLDVHHIWTLYMSEP